MSTLAWLNVLGAFAPTLGLLALFVRMAVRHEVTLRAIGWLPGSGSSAGPRFPMARGNAIKTRQSLPGSDRSTGPKYFFEIENLEDRRFVGDLSLAFIPQHRGGRIVQIALDDGIARRPTTEIVTAKMPVTIRIGELPPAARWRITVIGDGRESDIRVVMAGAGRSPITVHGREGRQAHRPVLGYSVLVVVSTLGLLAYLLPVVLGVVPFAGGEAGLGPADGVLAGALATVFVATFYAVRRPPSWSRTRRRPREPIR